MAAGQQCGFGEGGSSEPPKPHPSHEAVRAELGRVLASEIFAASDRAKRLLSLMVEYALTGRADQLNEYLLATEVLRRKPTFDPASDPIVRVEAGRLRRRLHEYYRTKGSEDPVTIELPQRTYVPTFHSRQPAATTVPAPQPAQPLPPRRLRAAWTPGAIAALVVLVAIGVYSAAALMHRSQPESRGPANRDSATTAHPPGVTSIVVLPFSDVSPARDMEYFCDGLAEELIDHLTRVKGLNVVARTTASRYKGKPADVRQIGRELGVALLLEGSVRKDGQRLRIAAQLINAADGYHLWSRTFDRDGGKVFQVQEEIANAVTASISEELTGRPPRTRAE